LAGRRGACITARRHAPGRTVSTRTHSRRLGSTRTPTHRERKRDTGRERERGTSRRSTRSTHSRRLAAHASTRLRTPRCVPLVYTPLCTPPLPVLGVCRTRRASLQWRRPCCRPRARTTRTCCTQTTQSAAAASERWYQPASRGAGWRGCPGERAQLGHSEPTAPRRSAGG
jgi:hypothetical protein